MDKMDVVLRSGDGDEEQEGGVLERVERMVTAGEDLVELEQLEALVKTMADAALLAQVRQRMVVVREAGSTRNM